MSSFNALYGRTSGVAVVQGPYLVFSSDVDGSQISLILCNMQIRVEGINSPHYYFFEKSKPDQQICIQDIGILKVLSERNLPNIIQALKKSQKHRLQKNFLRSLPIAISLSLLLAIPLLLSFIPVSWFASLLTPTQEKTFGEWILPMIRTQFQIAENHPAQPKIQALLEQLMSSNPELQNLSIKVYISNSRDVNAFAVPGNIIVVNKGFIESTETIEEVMGVLAHEVGHIEQRHVTKSLAGGLGTLAGTLILASFIGYEGSLVVAQTTHFLNLKYSRDNESSADKRGFGFLQNAGISPMGMINFFKKLEKSHDGLPALLHFASTHPAPHNRVKVLQEMAEKNPADANFKPAFELKDLQSKW